MKRKAKRLYLIFLLTCIIALISPVISASAEIMYVIVNGGSHLNARSVPIKGNIEAKLLRGWSVEVLSIEDGWAKITGYGESNICYVNSEYLSKEPPPDVEKCEPAVHTVTMDKVRLRESPNGRKIRWLYKGNRVSVTGWVTVDNICWARTDTGYIMAKYLDK